MVLPTAAVEDALATVVVDIKKSFCDVLVEFTNCAIGTGGRELCDEKIPHESGFHQAAKAIEGMKARAMGAIRYFFILFF